MTRSANSGPAVMLMPPHIRATFMPNPPLTHIPPLKQRRKHPITGVASYLVHTEKTEPPERQILPTPQSIKEQRRKLKKQAHENELEPKIEDYRKEQKECSGEYEGMNCYNTLFIGRLAYEVTERKLLRELETFGPIKDIKIVKDKEGKSCGYAFAEYEHEEDMKRAYRATDGMRVEGREIVVDVERGHTVPTWLPRRLGGGLGGTRLGGKHENVTRPGRFDPSRPEANIPMSGAGMGRGGGPPFGGSGHGGGFRDGPGPAYGMGRGRGDPYGGPPPPRDFDRGRGGDRGSRKRHRSTSPGHYGGGGSRRRY